MSLFFPGLTQATDNAGNPVSGAKWKFYVTGTSTPAAVYSDSTFATSLGSTVTSDTHGWFPEIYLDDSVTYRARLETSAGALIGDRDIDPVNGDASGFGGFVTPQQFGAIGGEVADDGLALNAWLAYIAENKVPFAALVGNYRTTIPIAYDFDYGDGGFTTDKLYTTTVYCHGRIRGDGAMDHLLEIKKAPFLKFVGNLHLLGLPDGQGFPWSTRTIETGFYYENCGNLDLDFLHVTGFKCYGAETGPAGTNNNHSRFNHIAGSRVGSGPRDGTADRGQRTTFSARTDTGTANSFGQRSVLTVAAMMPAYMDGPARCTEIRINGTGMLYTVLSVDRGANTISVFPWIEGGVTAGDIEYYFGAVFCARGNDANLIDIGTIQAQACGGALDLQCLYGGTYGTIHCEAGGVALRIGRDPASTILGASIGRLYCEGTTKDIRLNSGSAANIVIDSASPVEFDKFESGASVRDGAFVLSPGGFTGISIGADNGGVFVSQKRTGTTVALDFNIPRADRQYIATDLNLVLTDMNADLTRLFQMDGGLVTCRSATGGCNSIDFTSSGTMTVNGGATASFGPYANAVTFSIYANGTDWSIEPHDDSGVHFKTPLTAGLFASTQPWGSNSSTSTFAIDQLDAVLIHPARDFATSAISFEVSAFVAASNAKIAIYDLSSLARLAMSADIATAANGVKTWTNNFTFKKGRHYLIAIHASAAITVRAGDLRSLYPIGSDSAGINFSLIRQSVAYAGGPPATLAGTKTTLAAPPMFALTAA
jgi:hypothetical protein